METKDFKTIILRNMDSRGMEEIVKIMNEVMNKQGIKTAQSVIPFIIKEYDREKRENEDQRQRNIKMRKAYEDEINQLNARLSKAQKAIHHFTQFQLLANEL